MELFIMSEDNGEWYYLTRSGIVSLIVLSIILLLIIGFIKTEKRTKTAKTFSTKQIAFSAIAVSLSFVLSYVKLWHMPWGGSVTLCSMLFVSLIGYWYGLEAGLIAGFVYGILQFIQGGAGYILDPLQTCLDYFFAFTALGLTGLFKNKKKYPFETGYIVAVLARGALHTLGGYLYWMDYMPDNFPESLKALYPLLYNYAYILPEMILTLIVISLPPVKRALARIRETAV